MTGFEYHRLAVQTSPKNFTCGPVLHCEGGFPFPLYIIFVYTYIKISLLVLFRTQFLLISLVYLLLSSLSLLSFGQS